MRQRPQEQGGDGEFVCRQAVSQARDDSFVSAIAQGANGLAAPRGVAKSLAEHQPIESGVGARKGDIGVTGRSELALGIGRGGFKLVRQFGKSLFGQSDGDRIEAGEMMIGGRR